MEPDIFIVSEDLVPKSLVGEAFNDNDNLYLP